MQQLSLYWQASNPEQSPSTSSMELDSWQHVEHPAGGSAKPMPDSATLQHADADLGSTSSVPVDTDNLNLILPPTNCDLRVSMKTDKHTGVTHLGAVALVERVQLHLHKDQISDITRMQDQYAVWNLHNQYAVLRPTGWRSDAATAVTPRCVKCMSVACCSAHHGLILCCAPTVPGQQAWSATSSYQGIYAKFCFHSLCLIWMYFEDIVLLSSSWSCCSCKSRGGFQTSAVTGSRSVSHMSAGGFGNMQSKLCCKTLVSTNPVS